MESTEKIKRIQALAAAMKRQSENKATAEDLKLIGEASVNRPGDIPQARKAAGISGARGAKSAVEVTVNGKNGSSVGWQQFYALKHLADVTGGTVTIIVTPKDKPNAKPVSNDLVAKLFAKLDEVAGLQDGPTPSQCAELVAK